MKRLSALLLALVLTLGCFSGCKKETAGSASTTGAAQVPTAPQNNTPPADPNALTVNPQGLSLEENGIVYESLAQKAIVKTALAYLARGTRVQYADTRLNVNSISPITYRWQTGARTSPEEYTSQHIGYVNCGAFVRDVFLSALELRLASSSAGDLVATSGPSRIYRYFPKGNETPEQMAQIEQEFRANLKMGDIIAIRYNGSKSGTGHVMLYVGAENLKGVDGYRGTAIEGKDPTKADENDTIPYDIIHSTGNAYNFDLQKEKFEPYGTVQMMSVDALFDSANHRYVFGKLEAIAIIRPLATFEKDVPQKTQNRMLYMENIVTEKLSSHTAGMTVNPGDTMIFTFRITNNRATDARLEVKDTLSDNLTYVSSENCTAEGNTLSWIATVPAGKTVDITYTAKVKDTVAAGQVIESIGGTVGGIPVIAPTVFVGRTLSADEQAALLAAIAQYADSDLRGTALANALYGQLPGLENLLPDDAATILSSIFRTSGNLSPLNWEAGYIDMVAPGLFGGRYVPQRDPSTKVKPYLPRFENIRTRLPYPDQLMVGDILIAVESESKGLQRLYLFTGEKMLDLNSGETLSYVNSAEALEKVMAYNRFAIIRPSLMLDNKQ